MVGSVDDVQSSETCAEQLAWGGRRLTMSEGEDTLISVTERAKEVLRGYDRPEGTVLRLDPVNGHVPDEFQVRLASGEPRGDDQVVEHEGENVLRIAKPVSEELNGGTVDLVETLEGPAIGLQPPPLPGAPPLTDDS